MALIANGYKKGLTIERINNDGNYEPNNCKWVTKQEQNQNQRTTKITPHLASAIRLSKGSNVELAAKYGVDASTISRVRNGRTWSNID